MIILVAKCKECGMDLEAELPNINATDLVLTVKSCECAFDTAYEEGSSEGYDRGHKDGYKKAMEHGYNANKKKVEGYEKAVAEVIKEDVDVIIK